MNGNKKIAKKIVAGSMAVMMAAGLAGTYEYHNNVMQVQAAEQKDKDTQELNLKMLPERRKPKNFFRRSLISFIIRKSIARSVRKCHYSRRRPDHLSPGNSGTGV